MSSPPATHPGAAPSPAPLALAYHAAADALDSLAATRCRLASVLLGGGDPTPLENERRALQIQAEDALASLACAVVDEPDVAATRAAADEAYVLMTLDQVQHHRPPVGERRALPTLGDIAKHLRERAGWVARKVERARADVREEARA